MQPSDLKHNKQYHYTVIDQQPRPVTYRHEQLNYWVFDEDSTNKMLLLHKQQVLSNIHEFTN